MSKAADYRNRNKTALTLPSGEVFTVRRPSLPVWIASGKVPQSFLTTMLGAQGKTEAQIAAEMETAPDEEIREQMRFMGDLVRYAVVDPPLRDGAMDGDEDGALDPSEIDGADFTFLMNWAMRNAPDVPVEMEGGATSVESLNRFRQKRPGGGFVGDGSDGGEVRTEALATAQAAG